VAKPTSTSMLMSVCNIWLQLDVIFFPFPLCRKSHNCRPLSRFSESIGVLSSRRHDGTDRGEESGVMLR